MISQFTLSITTESYPIPDSNGVEVLGLIPSLNPDRPDIPVKIQAYGGNSTTLSQQARGSQVLATGRLRMIKNQSGATEAVFIVGSFQQKSNLVTIVGRLGADPDVKYFESGSVVAKGSIAVSVTKDGPPDWFNYEAWGKDAQRMADYCRKGTQLAMAGSVMDGSWVDKATGETRAKFVLKVSNFNFCGSKKDNETQAQSTDSYSPPPTAYRQPQELAGKATAPQTQQPKGGDYDDIPF
jgi:single-strand DNA-binding protein